MSAEPSASTIFNNALELHDPAARARFLDEACGADAALRERVEKLLRAHDEAGGFFSQPSKSAAPASGAVALPVTEKPGDKIGRYKLLQQIGEGGCGVVYMAEQEEPVRRRVALKVIKLGMDTKQVIARFEAERQALALMDHPNIAKIFDAGITDAPLPTSGHPLPVGRGEGQGEGSAISQPSTLNPQLSPGRPYFVMELVRGIKITDFCDENKLSTEDRLNLFMQVCQAIQHAHQKGVIHRDIKPSNILVTINDGVPVPKVIDFGIAKATAGRLTDQTLFTAFEQFIGTPAYMSPEQAVLTSLDIDTRSDIYSLGVLLYELLTGGPPFDQKELLAAGLDEMRRIIRETGPPRPSNRLSTMAAATLTTTAHQRHTEPRSLVHGVRGDLDWIVMKCLEKDRARRYETANALAADIRRHLESEPVVARPPSRLYEFQKTVRRHKFGFAAAGAVMVALAVGLGLATWTLVKEKEARSRAVAAEQEQSRLRLKAETNEKKAAAEAARSAQVAGFMKDMLYGVAPGVAMGRDTTLLREILDRTAERMGPALTNQPEVEAELRLTLGNTYFQLGETAKSEAMSREALALFRKAFGNENSRMVVALNNLAINLRNLGRDAEAEVLLREGLASQRKLSGDADPLVSLLLNNLGNVLRGLGRLEEAEAAHRQALTLRTKSEPELVPNTLYVLALDLRAQGKLADAEAMLRNSLEIFRRDRTETRARDVINILNSLADMLKDQRRLSEAEDLAREGLAMGKRRMSNDHPGVINSTYILASVLCEQDKPAEAAELSGDLLAVLEKKLPGNWQTFGIKSMLGNCLLRQTNYAQAEPLLVGGYGGLERVGAGIPAYRRYWIDDALKRLVRLYETTGQREKAAEWNKKLTEFNQAEAEKQVATPKP